MLSISWSRTEEAVDLHERWNVECVGSKDHIPPLDDSHVLSDPSVDDSLAVEVDTYETQRQCD